MSFVPVPQKANFASANSNNKNLSSNLASNTQISTLFGDANTPDDGSMFKKRTFDVYWVDKAALMYRDGYHKSYDRDSRKSVVFIKRKSSIPLILRDMAPPEGSIFDPAKKWEEKREKKRIEKIEEDLASLVLKVPEKKKSSGKKGSSQGKMTADSIKESNQAGKVKKDHERDLQKLSNLRSLKALQEASCETSAGKIHRMIKMLHLAVSDFKQGSVNASEAEILDILWAIDENITFRKAEKELTKEKIAKKYAKDSDKIKRSLKKDNKRDAKKEKKERKSLKIGGKTEKNILSIEAQSLKALFKDGGDNRGNYKESLKYARKLMSSKSNLISFQLTEMPDRLPPLSRYNRQFNLEEWQCSILEAIDSRKSAVVCAPTSSGKTLLSTYTCKSVEGIVLFVLPSEVLVWQIASMYYDFFRGNVTICTDQITFQEISGDAQVYIGTPRALEKCLTKVRGCAGQEMRKGEREFMILDGGYSQFKYLVLDEVHTLNGPEGDALQRIIRCCNCPFLALSATIGNSSQLQSWLEEVRNDHIDSIQIDGPSKSEDVILQEHFARFINLQRYVVVESEDKDRRKKVKLLKLHPIAAMTPECLQNNSNVISSLSMTPTDMIDIWKIIKSIFPSNALEKIDDPDNFFRSKVDKTNRITLNQTKDYEVYLKMRLTSLSHSHPDLYEKLRISHVPRSLIARKDVSGILYDVIEVLKKSDLLPAVAFQLDTYGAFNMFKVLLARLEAEQVAEFPDYRKDLIKLAREKAVMRKVAAGKADRINAAEAEEDAKCGFTDDSLVQEDTTRPHDRYVLSPAGKRLSFNEVEDIITDMRKSGEKVDINHALIRGLRRGIAIYTNEVGFSCYRRQVQMLAQKGRLAVVFSDSALAYGVNMPFRTCVFCGNMGNDLTPLIAQQMQGRAGRRGMDVQGNVIYMGMDWSYIRNLMLGQISVVHGKNPHYPIMALQRALAASNDPNDIQHFIHDKDEFNAFANAIRKIQRSQNCYPTVTDAMMRCMGKTTLKDFCEGITSPEYLDLSTKVIVGLGYVDKEMKLTMDHNVLSMLWEMHDFLPEGIHLCSALDLLYIRFCDSKTNVFKQTDSTQNDFLSVLLHIVDRVPAKENDESLQEFLRIVPAPNSGKVVNEDAYELWSETEKIIRKQKALIDSIPADPLEKCILYLDPECGTDGNNIGPSLDKGVYEMIILKQKGFREDQSQECRNDLKNRIVRLGQICLLAHNNLQQPHGKYNALEVHFRRLFSNIKYCVTDMMTQLTDQDDLTDV